MAIVFLKLVTIIAIFRSILGQTTDSSQKDCFDKVPNDGYNCSQQEKWGKCNAYWMVLDNLCAQTCGRCMSLDARLLRLIRTSINLSEKQSANNLAKNASTVIMQTLENNLQENFFEYEVSLFINDLDFLLLMGAAGVLHQSNLEVACPGGAGPQVRTISSNLEEFVLAVQLDGITNEDARFVFPVVTECPDASGKSQTRFEILHVEATFPNFVNEVQAIFTEAIVPPNNGDI